MLAYIIIISYLCNKVKTYLFDSSFMYWHKKNHIIDMVESKLDRPIEDITAEHINKFATENNIKFNKKK